MLPWQTEDAQQVQHIYLVVFFSPLVINTGRECKWLRCRFPHLQDSDQDKTLSIQGNTAAAKIQPQLHPYSPTHKFTPPAEMVPMSPIQHLLYVGRGRFVVWLWRTCGTFKNRWHEIKCCVKRRCNKQQKYTSNPLFPAESRCICCWCILVQLLTFEFSFNSWVSALCRLKSYSLLYFYLLHEPHNQSVLWAPSQDAR